LSVLFFNATLASPIHELLELIGKLKRLVRAHFLDPISHDQTPPSDILIGTELRTFGRGTTPPQKDVNFQASIAAKSSRILSTTESLTLVLRKLA
jgi:hypothetical protein